MAKSQNLSNSKDKIFSERESQQDSTKTTEHISTKLRRRTGLCAGQTQSAFGVDPGEGTDPGFYLLVS